MADATEKTIADEHPDACSRCLRVVEHLHVFGSRPGLQFCEDCAVILLTGGGL